MKQRIERKIMTLSEAAEWRAELRKLGKKLALTNGCFDLLHRGHAEYLLAARESADALIVLLNSDESIRRNPSSSGASRIRLPTERLK